MKDYQILDEKYLGNLILVTYTTKASSTALGKAKPQGLTNIVEGIPGNTNVAIASAVTAYSRMIINK
jgi:hypothetical protein